MNRKFALIMTAIFAIITMPIGIHSVSSGMKGGMVWLVLGIYFCFTFVWIKTHKEWPKR